MKVRMEDQKNDELIVGIEEYTIIKGGVLGFEGPSWHPNWSVVGLPFFPPTEPDHKFILP